MQPLDRTFFKALKSGYNSESDTWMVAHKGQRTSFFDMAGIFATAYNNTATIEKAINGFRVCGLWPYNNQIFSDEDFVVAEVTTNEAQTAPNATANPSTTTVTTVVTSQSTATTGGAMSVTTIAATTTTTASITIVSTSAKPTTSTTTAIVSSCGLAVKHQTLGANGFLEINFSAHNIVGG